MKVLVTGGAGFIGSNLVNRLTKDGVTVVVVDNLSTGFKDNLVACANLEFVEGDIRDISLICRVAKGVDFVFHFAASVGNKRSIDNPHDDLEINGIGSLNVIEAARRGGVRKVVASSSAGVFGELKLNPIDESHPMDPDTPYGASKLYMEHLFSSFYKLHGVSYVCLRYFNVFGINQRFDAYGNVIPIFVRNAVSGQAISIFGDGSQTRDFVNVQDVVDANLAAAYSDAIGCYNLGSGSAITINELADRIFEIQNLPRNVVYTSPRPGDVLHSRASIKKARVEFGFAPKQDFDSCLKEYILWYSEKFK